MRHVFFTRDMFFALYDSWRRAQILRKNVSSDALKLFYSEKPIQVQTLSLLRDVLIIRLKLLLSNLMCNLRWNLKNLNPPKLGLN